MAPTQTFQDHISELRVRLLWVFAAIGASAGLAYVLRAPLIKLVQQPLGSTLYYSSPAGSFNFIMKLSIIIGMFIGLPVIIYHCLRFIEPALPKRISKKLIASIIGFSFLLALMGLAFSYYYMVPTSLHFFSSYSTDQIKPLISANEYLSYLLNNLALFAIVFQIPLIILFTNKIKPLKPSKLLHYQRHVIVGSLTLAVVLPFTYDPLSQFIIAIPIIFLYYFSVMLLWIANWRRKPSKIKPAFQKPFIAPRLGTPLIPAQPSLSLPSSPLNFSRQPKAIDGFLQNPQNAFRVNVSPSSIGPIQTPAVVDIEKPTRKLGRPPIAIDGVSPFRANLA